MNKKLTKEQKEKRQHFLKITKNVVFYISLALNVLVVFAFAITGCSPKSNVQSVYRNDLGEATQLRKDKAITFNDFDNASVHSYDFTKFKTDYNFDYTRSINLSYPFNQDLVIISGNETIRSANYIHAVGELHTPTDNGDYLQVDARHYENGSVVGGYILYIRYTYSWEYGWTIVSTDGTNTPYYSSSNGFSMVYNSSNTSNDSFNLDWLDFFEPLDTQSYDLSQNWSPYAFYSTNDAYIHEGIMDDFYILEDTLFSINGNLYTDLHVEMTDNRAIDGSYINIDVNNGVDTVPLDRNKPYSWAINVEAINSFTNSSLYLFTLPQGTARNDNQVGLILKPTQLQVKNYSNLRVKQFAINLDHTTANGYYNGNALAVEFNYSSNSASSGGQIVNVLNLFSNAFNGIASILAIQILPGFTLGLIIFIPLVTIIIFAVVRIIKK